MQKLRMDPDTLCVETFGTHAPAEPRGTVEGREMATTFGPVCPYQCPPQPNSTACRA